MNLTPFHRQSLKSAAAAFAMSLVVFSASGSASQILSGYLNDDGEIVVVSLYENQGFLLDSSTENLVPLPPGDLTADPDPYTLLLHNDERNVTWGNPGTDTHLEGSFNTGVKLTDGDVSAVRGWYGFDPIQFRIFDTQPPKVTATFDVGGGLVLHGQVPELIKVAVESPRDEQDRRNRFNVQWFDDLSGLDGSLSLPFESDTYPVSEDFDLVAIYCQEDGNCREIEFETESECRPTFGDFNGDGQVSFADFLIIAFNFGKEVPDHRYGDADCDGEVDFADFLVNSSCFGACGTAGAQPVPEPRSDMIILMLAVGGVVIWRERDIACTTSAKY